MKRNLNTVRMPLLVIDWRAEEALCFTDYQHIWEHELIGADASLIGLPLPLGMGLQILHIFKRFDPAYGNQQAEFSHSLISTSNNIGEFIEWSIRNMSQKKQGC